MKFWYIPPLTGGGGGSGTTINLINYEDLSSQIGTGSDTFTVDQAKYTAGSLACSVGGLVMQKGTHFTEHDPATGVLKTARPLTTDDAPIIVSYKY